MVVFTEASYWHSMSLINLVLPLVVNITANLFINTLAKSEILVEIRESLVMSQKVNMSPISG